MGSCPDTDIDPHFLFTRYSFFFFFFATCTGILIKRYVTCFRHSQRKNAVKSQGAQVLYEVRFHSVTP